MNDRPTLKLPADRVQADDGAFLITVPPEPLPQPYHTIESGFVPAGPPSVLVALNQPCPTCDGDCITEDYVPTGRGRPNGIGLCGVCGGSGRLVFDLKTPCTHCLSDHPGWMLSGGNEKRLPDGRWVWLCSCRHPDRPFDEPFGIVTHRVWLDPEWGIRQNESGNYEARVVRFR